MRKYFLIFALIGIIAPTAAFAAFGDTSAWLGKPIAGNKVDKLQSYLDFPEGMTMTSDGVMYIADTQNHVIRKVQTNGIVRKVVGSAGEGDVNAGKGNSKFRQPTDVAVDSNGNVYIADSGNGKIKRFDGTKVVTLVDGLDDPQGIFIRNNKLYFTDYGTGKLYSSKMDGTNRKTITSSLKGPKKLYVRTTDDIAYVANALDFTIVKVTLSNGSFSTVAGKSGTTGTTTGHCTDDARFKNIWSLTVDEGGGYLNGATAQVAATSDSDDIYYCSGTADLGNDETSPGIIQNGNDVSRCGVVDIDGSDLDFDIDDTVIIDHSSPVNSCAVKQLFRNRHKPFLNFVSDVLIHDRQLFALSTGFSQITTLPLDELDNWDEDENVTLWFAKSRYHNKNGLDGLPGKPKDLVFSKDKKTMYFTENHRVKRIKLDGKKRRLKNVSGDVVDNYNVDDNTAYVGTDARFSDPSALDIYDKGKKLFVTDKNNNRIVRVDIVTKEKTYITGAGDINTGGNYDNGYSEGVACPNEFDLGVDGCAYFTKPAGIAVTSNGKYAYVADAGNNVIRRVTLRGNNKGKTKLIAGKPGVAGFRNGIRKGGRFDTPLGLSLTSDDRFLFVADRENHAIRKVRLKDGKVTTITGHPSSAGYLDGLLDDALLNLPVDVFVAGNGDIFFTEAGTHMVRVVDKSDGVVKLVAGQTTEGYKEGSRFKAQFSHPVGIEKKGDKLFVADSLNDTIRRIKLGKTKEYPYTEATPVVTGVAPGTNWQSGDVNETKFLTVYGDNFRHGAVGYFGTYKAKQTFVNSADRITVEIPFGAMPAGYYEVRIKNTDGQSGYRSRAYSVRTYHGDLPDVEYRADR